VGFDPELARLSAAAGPYGRTEIGHDLKSCVHIRTRPAPAAIAPVAPVQPVSVDGDVLRAAGLEADLVAVVVEELVVRAAGKEEVPVPLQVGHPDSTAPQVPDHRCEEPYFWSFETE
jgi:hypothetical protein